VSQLHLLGLLTHTDQKYKSEKQAGDHEHPTVWQTALGNEGNHTYSHSKDESY
jgi:hypothetical protein